MVYVFIYAVLKYWMVLVLMSHDYVEHCTGQCNYSRLEGLLNAETFCFLRWFVVKTQPRLELNSWRCHRCPCDPSGFLHLSCKRGNHTLFYPSFLYFVCLICQGRSSCAMTNITKLPQWRSILKEGSSSDCCAHGTRGQSRSARLGCWSLEMPSEASVTLGQKETLWQEFAALGLVLK